MNFDQITNRTEYPALKWQKSQLQEHFGNADALPFWVADMDFPAPQIVIDSLRQRVEHGIYGYEYKTDGYFDALLSWYARRHQWSIDPAHIEACPSVLNAVSILIDQHSERGDGIIIQPPVFFEFRQVIRANGRRIVKNPLLFVDGLYQIDFADLEAKAAKPQNKLLILCNPHNPIGRVWTREELAQVGEICQRHNVLIISDEIHGDITYPPHRYTPLASISDKLAQISFTCLSPAKTFNIAGMVDAMTVIPNEAHRAQFHYFAHRYQINKTNVFASAAIEAAYSHGEPWLEALLAYLQKNVAFIRSYLQVNINRVSLVEPEGTYLIWLNFAGLELDAKLLAKFLAQNAGIAVNPGYWFGREGAGFARMNIACPQPILQEAMSRLAQAIETQEG
jgi:cystathionine beta-lyase